MFVLVTAGGGSQATVEDAGNLGQLHVEFRGVSDDAGSVALTAAGLGSIDAEQAWLDIAALRAAGGASVRAAGDDAADWGLQFDAMIAYAASKGWTEPGRSAVRAHIVRT
jgi:hypothetical protein